MRSFARHSGARSRSFLPQAPYNAANGRIRQRPKGALQIELSSLLQATGWISEQIKMENCLTEEICGV
jgi:hypothetical protein